MNFVSLLFVCLSSASSLKPIIVKGNCNQSPYEICESSSKIGITATSKNINFLIKLLKASHIENAYVYGWNDHSGLFVLYENGALAPYDKFTNMSEYAFCADKCGQDLNVTPYVKPCPAPQPCHVTYPTPMPCPVSCPPQQPCPVTIPCPPQKPCPVPISCPLQQPCPVPITRPPHIPCHPKQQPFCRRVCRDNQQRPNICKRHPQNSHPLSIAKKHLCKQIRPCCPTFQQISLLDLSTKECGISPSTSNIVSKRHKSFQIRCLNPHTSQIKTTEAILTVKTTTQTLSDKESFVNKKIPVILQNLKLLRYVKCELEREFRSEVCLYVTNESNLYAFVNGCLYYLTIYKHEHSYKVKTKYVSNNKIYELASRGLYYVDLTKHY